MDLLERCARGESELQRAVHAGLQSRWRLEQDVAWAPTGSPHRILLGGMAVTSSADAAQLATVAGSVGDPFGLFDPEDLPGRTLTGTTAWMHRDPQPPPTIPMHPDLVVRRIVRSADVATWERTVFEANGDLTREPGELHPAASVHVPGLALYLAELDGKPVGTSLRVVGRHGVTVSAVAVLPEVRGQGIGLALTHRAVAAAPELPATLSASAMGEGLYERLGFRKVGLGVTWSPLAEALGGSARGSSRRIRSLRLSTNPLAKALEA
ncbi:GNAT family N-acetyltransferase [Gulosibacter macacae]|nr:GNAT family N-acetyltransferase [Gulosibacter macacae]